MRRSIVLVCLSFLGSGCSHGDPGGPTGAAAAAPATAAATAPAAAAAPVYRVPIEGLPVMGKDSALVTIVEFIDYECPFSRRAEQTITKLRGEYGDDLRVVVAMHPLPMHDHARPAALAALAADRQGRLDAMQARLFEGKLDDGAIAAAAREVGVTLGRDDQAAREALASAETLADKLGVRGTPSFFVNGRSVLGAQPYEVIKKVVDEQLAAAKAMVADGVRRGDVYGRAIANGLDKLKPDEDEGTCNGGKACDGKDGPAVGDKVERVVENGAPARGPSLAQVTIVEFADYQCPFCARAEATLRAVEAAHPGGVRVVFKNLPLPFHDHARDAAKAAVAADAQGRFWEMHDRLYADGAKLDRPSLDATARDLGLDVARFDRDMDDPRTDARVATDEADAQALGVKGTPTFFVNGRRVIGAQPPATFEAAIAKR